MSLLENERFYEALQELTDDEKGANVGDLLRHITAEKKALAYLEKQVKTKKQELEASKSLLMGYMRATGSKRTEGVDGYFVVRQTKSTPYVNNPDEVQVWLLENNFNLEEYQKLDDKRVLMTAEAMLKETGEVMPGIEVEETEYLSIREDKNGK